MKSDQSEYQIVCSDQVWNISGDTSFINKQAVWFSMWSSLPEYDWVHPREVCHGAGEEVLADEEGGGVVVRVEGGQAQARPLAPHHIAGGQNKVMMC